MKTTKQEIAKIKAEYSHIKKDKLSYYAPGLTKGGEFDSDYVFLPIVEAYEIAHRLVYELENETDEEYLHALSKFVQDREHPIREIMDWFDRREAMTPLLIEDQNIMLDELVYAGGGKYGQVL